MLQPVIYVAMAVLMFLVLWLRGDASAGDLVAYITAAGLLPKPIRQLSEVSSTVQRGVAGAESIFEQLDEAPEEDRGTVEKERVGGRLEVRNLSFRYPGTDKQVLDDISFVAEPGQMIALVGRSGSGKSTLANLVPRFYQHNEGQILLDGVEIEDYRLRNLRRHIALVTQQVTLFNDSVANNIAYGDLAGAPREQIERAAKAANAKEFIDNLPQGFDTEVGENGVLLSGGQRQRLAIARALLKDAPLLILDEAWLFLDDPLFAARIRQWLKTLRKKNVSVIFATQSLADIKDSSIAAAIIESCASRIFLPNPQAGEPQIRGIYQSFGLNDRQIEIITHATPKRDYYYQSRLGNRLFDLDLGPVALAFAASASPAEQREIDRILQASDAAGFAPAWLHHRGLDWAADLLIAYPSSRKECLP